MPGRLESAVRAALLPALALAVLLYRRWPRRAPAPPPDVPAVAVEQKNREGTVFRRVDSEASQFHGGSSPALVPARPPTGLTIEPYRQTSSWEMTWANPEEYTREPMSNSLSASFCPVAINRPTTQPARPQSSIALSNLSLLSDASAGFTVSTTCSVIRHAIYSTPRHRLTPGSTLDCIVSSMDEWLLDFTQQRDHLGHSQFWHRTSKKIVLSILALRLDDNLVFVRGCNLEVSLPSGSLCSERNAFGTALTMYPFLHREHFVGVAVLSLTEGDANLNPLPPCGVCSAWIDKIHEVNKEFRVVTFSDMSLQQVHITTLSPLATALQAIRDAEALPDGPRNCQLSEAVQLAFHRPPRP